MEDDDDDDGDDADAGREEKKDDYQCAHSIEAWHNWSYDAAERKHDRRNVVDRFGNDDDDSFSPKYLDPYTQKRYTPEHLNP